MANNLTLRVTQRVEMAAMGAVQQFNEGASSKHLVMENAGIYFGKYSVTGSAQKDKKRVQNPTYKASQKQKRVRKIRQAKLKAEEERKSREGTTCSSGKFNDINPLEDSSDDDIPLAQVKAEV